MLCLLLAILPQTALALTDTESNDVFASAQKVTPGETIEGMITSKDVDIYTITLGEAGRLKLDMTAYMQYYTLNLYNAEGTEVWYVDRMEWNANVGYRNDVFNLDLEAATYFIKVTGFEHGSWNPTTGTYKLKVGFTSAEATETEYNDSFATANTLNIPSTTKGQIALNGRYDFFKVVLSESGRLSLDMASNMQYYTLELFNAEGVAIWSVDDKEWNGNTGYRNDVYKIDLEAGTYFVKVTGYKFYDYTYYTSTGTYTLKVDFAPADATEVEYNDSLADANAIELNSTTKGQIAINGRYDFFKMVISEPGRLKLDMTSYMQYYTLEVINADGMSIWQADEKEWNGNTGYRNDAYDIDLETGTYYIKVTGYQYYDYFYYTSTGNYTLKSSFVACNGTEVEENDSLETANAVALNSTTKGQISINDRYDFYQVELPTSGRLNLNMTVYFKNYTLHLYDESGTELWYADHKEWNQSAGFRNDIYNLDLEAGIYNIKVTGYRYAEYDPATGTYELKNKFTSANATEVEHNDSLADGNSIGLTSITKGQIAINDPYDFYEVVMPKSDKLKINITSYMQYYTLHIYNEAGTELWTQERKEWNAAAGFRSDEYYVDLPAGTYYIKVTGYRYNSYDASTGNYMLLLNHTHKWDNGVITKIPTATSNGEKTFTCQTCGATSTKVVKFLNIARIYGATRYQTSFGIADALKEELGISKFRTIIVASGTNFADALSGSYLASVKDAPILITNGGNMEQVKTYIKNNLRTGGTVYLLGGTAAVPASMEKGLDNFYVKRLGGATRYETNLLILKEAGVYGRDILVCTGTGFADSLSASAAGQPILLVAGKLNPQQEQFLATTSGKKIIIGGTSAVNSRVEDQLKAYGSVTRIGGATRYETSVKVAETFFSSPDGVVLAYAQNFPDGLCGGPLANNMNAPLILTATGKQKTAAEYVKLLSIDSAYVLGGPGLISDAAVRTVFDMDADAAIPVK